MTKPNGSSAPPGTVELPPPRGYFTVEAFRASTTMVGMSGWLKHPLRVTGRLLWLGVELLLAMVRYRIRLRQSEAARPHARALWLQHAARRLLSVIKVRIEIGTPVPSSGLLVANHLGYLDILVLASLTPAVFVSKSEVRNWPVFGWFARRAGTVFVERDRRSQAAEATVHIESALNSGVLTVLFPEGTSSDGKTVLPFKSSLLEPAVRNRLPLTAGFIRYELDDGDPGQEVSYWKDMVLVPHLINLLGKRRVRAFVRFAPVEPVARERKAIARQLHSEVMRLKQLELGVAAGTAAASQRFP